MEPHKKLSGTEVAPNFSLGAKKYFSFALKFVSNNYQHEMNKISSVKFEEVDEDFFFKEYVWVVHATGFSAKAVGKFIPSLLEAYGYWDRLANESFENVMIRVKTVCNNPQKAAAVHSMAKLLVMSKVSPEGNFVSWSEWKQNNLSTPELLMKLPYIGKVTCFHLSRNIGLLDFVKPDLHLVRMAEYWGFEDCIQMCKHVQPPGMPLGIVDLIFWYTASTFGTTSIRKEGMR